MAIKNKRPPRKESVGAQYVCFSTPGEDDEWSGQYEEDVERTAVVKSVSVTDNSESQDVYASGEVYDTDQSLAADDIEVEVIAFPADTLAKMRAETVDEGGLIKSGSPKTRPFFAYGKVVKLKTGILDLSGIQNVSSNRIVTKLQHVRNLHLSRTTLLQFRHTLSMKREIRNRM